MPTKPISDRQRLITYASQCDREQLAEAIETFQAILAGRFPREPRKSATGRKARDKQPSPAQPTLTERLANNNNGSDDASANSKHGPRRKVDKFVPAAHMVAAIEENKHNRIEGAEMMED